MNRNLSAPDLILSGGIIRTLDEAIPTAQAMAVKKGRILALGTDPEILALAGPDTDKIDLNGRLCLPGFFDSHFHFYQWALGRTEMDFSTVSSFARAMELIAARAEKAGPGAWLTGYGFNESDWPENRIPNRFDLDRAGNGLPALIWRCDLHLAVASTKALELAGVGENTPDPEGGIIERDQTGALTGVLREGAINLVKNSIPEPEDQVLEQAMAQGIKGLHALGITALHDVRLSGVQKEAARTLGTWQILRQKGLLDLRCFAAIPGECLDLAVNLGLRTGFGDERLKIGHVKYFMDGGMGARTGWTLDPYLDTGETGVCVYEPDKLYQQIKKAHEHGLAAMVHAIGDRASREITNVYEKLFKTADSPGPALPHRVEHAQMIRTEDIARLSYLPVAVSAQPPNMILDINMIDACMGDLGKYAYPFRLLAESGIDLMFSSDCPVCDPNPLVGIHAAVNRAREDGTPEGGWHPEHKVRVMDAVKCYTRNPAKIHGARNEFGTLRPGLFADMAVLDRDIFEIAPLDIVKTKVDMTVFNGKVVYRR